MHHLTQLTTLIISLNPANVPGWLWKQHKQLVQDLKAWEREADNYQGMDARFEERKRRDANREHKASLLFAKLKGSLN